MAIVSKTNLKAYINQKINSSKPISQNELNKALNDMLDSLPFDYIVASTGDRNSIPVGDRFEGLKVYVKGGQLYILEANLTSWSVFYKNSYSSSQIDTLLDNKVDKIDGKGLSQQDFTTDLLEKLNNIVDEATQNLPDEDLLNRENHTGEQDISTITNLQNTLDAINDSISSLQDKETILVKSINLTSDSIYNIDVEEDFTVLVDCTSGNKIVVLPNSNQNIGRVINIKKIDNSVNKVTIYPSDYDDSSSGSDGYEQIEFISFIELNSQGDNISIQAYINNWYKIN